MALLLLAAACGGATNDGGQPEITVSPGSGFDLLAVTSDLAVGPSRFIVELVDPAGGPEVTGARLHLRFFFIDPVRQNRKTYKNETDTVPIKVSTPYTHTHLDGALVRHEAGGTGIHAADVAFDQAGDWVVEVTGDVAGKSLPLLERAFQVPLNSLSPTLGTPAPASVQPILSDVKDITEIDSSSPPNPEMHDMTIAAAVSSGRPSVIAFASAGVCASPICGPAKETVDELWQKYNGQANFIHVEPYDLKALGDGAQPQPLAWVTAEWGVQSEPWIFLVDSQGFIADKFQVLAGYDELDAAIARLLSSRPP